MVVIPVR
jgi:hypothetical protein